MKVSNCQKCKHYRRRVWSSRHQPTNYHAIGMSHAYGYCEKHKTRCLQVKGCKEAEIEKV